MASLQNLHALRAGCHAYLEVLDYQQRIGERRTQQSTRATPLGQRTEDEGCGRFGWARDESESEQPCPCTASNGPQAPSRPESNIHRRRSMRHEGEHETARQRLHYCTSLGILAPLLLLSLFHFLSLPTRCPEAVRPNSGHGHSAIPSRQIARNHISHDLREPRLLICCRQRSSASRRVVPLSLILLDSGSGDCSGQPHQQWYGLSVPIDNKVADLSATPRTVRPRRRNKHQAALAGRVSRLMVFSPSSTNVQLIHRGRRSLPSQRTARTSTHAMLSGRSTEWPRPIPSEISGAAPSAAPGGVILAR